MRRLDDYATHGKRLLMRSASVEVVSKAQKLGHQAALKIQFLAFNF